MLSHDVTCHSRLGSHNTSRRQSTEESIDTDDEWYKHEIQELEKEEFEKKIECIKPSDSTNSKLSDVLIELTATVAEVEYDDCQRHSKDMKAEQEENPGPWLPPPEGAALLENSFAGPPVGVHIPLTTETNLYVDGSTSDIDHKKVIMCFQGSEDFEAKIGLNQLDLEDEEGESLHDKKRNQQGHSDESSPDSDATQSGPDSLMEDTGGSSDNILDSSNQEKKNQRQETVVSQQPLQPLQIKSVPSSLPIVEAVTDSKISLPWQDPQSCKSSSSTGSSRHSRKSMKGEVTMTASANYEALAEAGGEREDEWTNDEYVSGGYYDENGEWVEAFGYYDQNGDWVETGGYYDDTGKWVEYAGYYDENGDWIDVEVSLEHQQEQEVYQEEEDQYYAAEDTGGGNSDLGMHERSVASS